MQVVRLPAEEIGMRQSRTYPNGYVVMPVPQDAYDWLCNLGNDGSEYLIRECLHGRPSVTLRPAYLLGSGGRVRLIAAALKAAGRPVRPGGSNPSRSAL